MRPLFILLLVLTVCAAALLHFDRASPAALYLVELESSLELPLPAVLGGLTLATWLLSGRKKYRVPPTSPPARQRGHSASPQPNQGALKVTSPAGVKWLDHAKASAKQLALPTGARIVFELRRRSPIELHLEQAPPERCRRSIELLGRWLTTIPTPPRVRVVFDHCPTSGSPRHHQVSGALAQNIDRGHFKATVDLDAVDVMFHHADPCWQEVRVQT